MTIMEKPRVYITREIPAPGIDAIASVCEVVVRKGPAPPSRAELARALGDFDATVCLLTDQFDKEIMCAAPRLRVISTMSVGFDHIDVGKATEMGIYVTNTPGVLTDATADFASTLLMASTRRIGEAERYVRSRKWRIPWSPTLLLGEAVFGKTLGIVGLGRIGSAVAERAKGFNMKILYHDTARAPPEREDRLAARFVALDELLETADFVSLHIPLTEQTRNLINEERCRTGCIRERTDPPKEPTAPTAECGSSASYRERHSGIAFQDDGDCGFEPAFTAPGREAQEPRDRSVPAGPE